MKYLFCDTETFCATPIKNGTFAYAEKAEVLLWTYAFEDGAVGLWDVASGEDIPQDLEAALVDPEVIWVFHNAVFDVTVIREALGLDFPIERARCSMARAYAHGLPGSLNSLCTILGLKQEHKKSKEGYALIRLFCIPPAKNVKRGRATAKTHPKEWETFKAYAKQDIVAMREVWHKLPEWNYRGDELKLWMLDAKINRRGICIDLDLVTAAIKAVDRAQASLKDRTSDLTFGDVSSTTKRDALLKHILEAYGVDLPDMQAGTLERRIEDPDLPVALRELLAIRLQATTSSTAKYKKIMQCVSSDGRLRGTLQWCGAARTGRDGGRLLQPQNLPRPTMKSEEIEFGIEALKADCADIFYPNVMALASNTIRGVIIALSDKKLLVADLASIEGRYAAWVGKEQWKLDAYQDFDTILGYDEEDEPIRKGPDTYKLGYSKMFRIKPEDVTKEQRDTIGKTSELALQFGGGVGAFATFAMNFGTDLKKMAEEAYEIIPRAIMEEAYEFWEWAVKQKRTLGFSEDVFVVCDSFKRMWRAAHPGIVGLWKDLQDAVVNAITTKDKTFSAGPFLIRRDGSWLRIAMPSGRALCYPHPQVSDNGEVSFMGINQYSRQWSRIKSYGPKFFENTVQGGARDIFMQGVKNAEKAGYECVSRIHDEGIYEVPDLDHYSVAELCKLMTTNIPWARGLPLAAAGFESYRYRKD